MSRNPELIIDIQIGSNSNLQYVADPCVVFLVIAFVLVKVSVINSIRFVIYGGAHAI